MLISVVPTQWIADFSDSASRSWLLEQAQIESTSDLNIGNFFEPGIFKGVSVATTVICLLSCQAASRILNSDHYRTSSIDAFEFFIDNDAKHWNELHRIKMMSKSADEAVDSVRRLVSTILQDTSNETVHLVRQYNQDYALMLLEKCLPEYAYKLRKAPQGAQQLDLDVGVSPKDRVAA